MMADKWEVVARNAKKNKKADQENKSSSKNQVQKFIANMPTVNNKPAVKESSSIFDAFLLKEKKEAAKKASEMNKKNNKENQVNKNKNQQQSKQPKKDNKKEIKKDNKKDNGKKDGKKISTLEDAVNAINVDELSSILTSDQERFSTTPLIWLKDLVAYLNLKINLNIPDPVFSGKPANYPYNIIPRSMKSVITDTFKKCPHAALKLFYEYAITNCIEDTINGIPTVGYRIIIQSLAVFMPTIALNNLQKFKDLRGQHQNRTPICLTILWSLGQCGIKSVESGLKIWLELMLPLIGVRAYSQYTISYLDALFTTHSDGDIASCGQVFGIREFFPILDVIFAHGINLPLHLHKQILTVYPKLKKIAFGPEPNRVLHNYFPSFFIRLVPAASPDLKVELLDTLTNCLVTDHQCYNVWKQLHNKHLPSSSLLLDHLVSNWDFLGPRLPKKQLRSLLESFQIPNVKQRNSHSNSPAMKKCDKTSRELLDKMKVSAMFPWRWFFLPLIILIGGLLAYDINSSGSFKASTTARWMNDAGVLSTANYAWVKVEKYSQIGADWCGEHIPVYIARLQEVSGPYVKLFWDKLYVCSVFVVDNTAGIREELNKRVPKFLQWINDNMPILIQQQLVLLSDLWGHVSRFAIVIWTWLCGVCLNAGTWLTENVLVGTLSPENLEKYTLNAIETMHGYTITVYQWINQQISGLTAD